MEKPFARGTKHLRLASVWAIAAAPLLLMGSASRGEPAAQIELGAPAVVELFTSQGCSSCPPADKLLASYARGRDVIALSLPVDYWDYIGWKDTFASPAFSARQKAYAVKRGDGHVYTPQVVVDGLRHAVGSDLNALRAMVKESFGHKGALKVSIAAKLEGDKLVCNLGAAAPGAPAKAGLWLYRISGSREVSIGRGENRGRKVVYVNVVRSMHKAGEWAGKPVRIEIPAEALKRGDGDGWVLLLQAGDIDRPGVILAAAKAPGF